APVSKAKPIVTEATSESGEIPGGEKPSEAAELHERTQNKLVDEALSTFANLSPEAIEELTREVERKIRNQIS
ncbi:MAG TPA: hypothetical protein VN867_02680, partial [Candidatus Binataceae bacterium]|nr:hypothetical protein [Candidatus Binataceae bacterium]